MTDRNVTVAATQMACSWDTDANISNAEKLVRDCAERGANIILIQEHKLEQRSAMMGELERRDKKIVQLQRDMMNITTNEMEKLSLNTSVPQVRIHSKNETQPPSEPVNIEIRSGIESGYRSIQEASCPKTARVTKAHQTTVRKRKSSPRIEFNLKA